ncbi:MAG: hypothetical protein NZ853_10805 [Leptospiraceae bacterium]|nr:hypothetical protein [Leptospiraceae bacterium]MDW7977057.1 hypothetical protein [Leptospiraceae bacterium]
MNLIKQFRKYELLIILILTPPLYAECNFEPNSDEGYVQIWNYHHHSDLFHIYITFMVSNLGDGDFNNGVTLFLVDKRNHQKYLKALEFTNQNLRATPKKWEITLEKDNAFFLKNHEIYIKANSGEDNPILQFDIAIPLARIHNQKHSLTINDQSVDFEILFLNPQKISFDYYEKKISLYGKQGIECLLSKSNPLKIADSIHFLRSLLPEPENQAFLFLIEKNNSLIQGKTFFGGIVNDFEITKTQEILKHHGFFIKNQDCEWKFQSLTSIGSFEVLQNVSLILRYFLKLIGINPEIVYSLADTVIECEKKSKIHKLPDLHYTQIRF